MVIILLFVAFSAFIGVCSVLVMDSLESIYASKARIAEEATNENILSGMIELRKGNSIMPLPAAVPTMAGNGSVVIVK